MKHKILIGFLIATLLVGCGSNNNAANDSNNMWESNNSANNNSAVYDTNEPADEEESSDRVTTDTSKPSEPSVKTSEWWDSDEKVQLENFFKEVKEMPLSTFSIDVDTASYSNMRRFLQDGMMPPEELIRIEEMVNYFDYNHDEPKNGEPLGITTELGVCPWNEENVLAMVGLKASDMDLEDLPNTNIVFLLDVSGSMSSPDKLPLLKKGFEMLVEQLTEDDRVSIVVYAGNSGVVLRGAHGDEKEEIIEAIYDLRAGGSTAGAAGIQKAYELAERYYIKNGNNRVILATDGDFNVGISSESELISFIEEKRETGIHLSVLGFGTGNLKDSKLEALADHGNGNYAYIDSVLEAKKVLVKEMYSTIYTLAKDTKIQIEFNPGMVQSYRLIGYENRRLNNRDFTDDTKDAGEIGVGHTVTAFYELIPADTTEGQKLKYSANQQSADGEWMEVRVRYKKPNQATSTELIHPVEADALSFNNSIDFNFASSVIEFGMLLQGSEYIGSASYRNVIETAKASKGLDEEGYRAQFIHLVEIAESLD